MSAKISKQYLDGLTGQGRLMVQTLVSSACSLMAAAERSAAQKSDFCKEVFGRQVQQLMLQRELAAEIVAWEFEQAYDPYETINLQWVVEDLCRQAEVRVLEVQAAQARAAGDETLVGVIKEFLAELQGTDRQSGPAEGSRPIPWVTRVVKAA